MTTEITIRPATGTWVIRADGAVLAETENALELSENGYPPVIYFPRTDVGMDFFEKSKHTTICPHKGTATYYSIAAESGQITDAAWSYEDPKPAVKAITDHLAFYANKVVIEKV